VSAVEKLIIGGLDMWGNMQATQALFDAKVMKVHNIKMEALIQDEMMMALRDEVMEYAKSTKCFKVWSFKDPDPEHIRLEEFADGIHLYLGQFNRLGLNPADLMETVSEADAMSQDWKSLKLTKKQLLTYLLSTAMDTLKTPSKYADIKDQHQDLMESFSYFIAAGRVDGFTDQDIERGYYLKNRINQERLKSGY
jgi:dimeric dUTPase (all-alpha-NTP-PPase superfamily)